MSECKVGGMVGDLTGREILIASCDHALGKRRCGAPNKMRCNSKIHEPKDFEKGVSDGIAKQK